MGWRWTKRLKAGPARFNLTPRGLSSISWRAGRVTHNTRRGTTVRLPFGFTWRSKRSQ